MAFACVDDVVSPELALVDPDLAERARAALPLRGPTDRVLAARAQQVTAAERPPGRRRLVPVVALASVGVASMFGAGSTPGDPPSASTTAIAGTSGNADSSVAAPSSAVQGRTSTGAGGTIASADATVPATEALGASPGSQQPALQPSAGVGSVPGTNLVPPRAALRPMTLVWTRVAGVSSYDIELVRNGLRIYAVSSASPTVDLPRSWTQGGKRFSVQPEDQAFVWPVIDGRRAAEPVVNGTLALDNTPIARFTG